MLLECVTCTKGKYSPAETSVPCIPCSPGKFAAEDKAGECISCADGKLFYNGRSWKRSLSFIVFGGGLDGTKFICDDSV